MTTDEIKEKIVEAAKSGDMETVTKLSAELKDIEAAAEKQAKDAETRREAQLAKEAERERLKAEKERLKYEKKLYPEDWMRRIPLGRRFVMAQEYVKPRANSCDRDEHLCPVDLITGHTEPYFRYYGNIRFTLGDHANFEVLEELRDTFDVFAYFKRCRYKHPFQFFQLDNKETFKFAICKWKVDLDEVRNVTREDGTIYYLDVPYDAFTVKGHGEFKTLAEHQADLRKEFGGESSTLVIER